MRECRAEVVQVQVSVPSSRVGARLARALVESRLAACVQILGPIQSHYRWRGRIERAREWLLLIKTRGVLLDALEAELQRLHPYEVPEILAIPVQSAHAPYLDWLRRECPRRRRRDRAGA